MTRIGEPGVGRGGGDALVEELQAPARTPRARARATARRSCGARARAGRQRHARLDRRQPAGPATARSTSAREHSSQEIRLMRSAGPGRRRSTGAARSRAAPGTAPASSAACRRRRAPRARSAAARVRRVRQGRVVPEGERLLSTVCASAGCVPLAGSSLRSCRIRCTAIQRPRYVAVSSQRASSQPATFGG